MAYLTKEQYARRRANAEERNAMNEEIAINNGMTECQASLIGELCCLRHKLHCSVDRLTTNSIQEVRQLTELNIRMEKSGLEPMNFVPLDMYDEFEDIDCLDVLYETEELPKDDNERREWLDSQIERIHRQWHEMNKKIETYLRNIDKKYNTHFEPTGALRIY